MAGSRSGTLGSVPSSFSTGAKYAGLGYGTAVDAAIAPLGARATHHEFRDTPIIDKAFLVLVGNNHYAMDRIRLGERDRLKGFLAWLLGATRGFGVKVVNPGGVEAWKQGGGNVAGLDDVVPHFEVTPRSILTEIARAVDELGLPHPMHLHGLNLGLPGNASTMLETMKALDGHRAHLAHVQFHSYGGHPGDLGRFDSQAGPLADYVNAHPNLTVDVGQVLFGETTSMTADGAVGQFLHKVLGRKWASHDLELETGCGVVPITYDDKNAVHALQWAIGLEWYLRVDDPWRVAMSTDHPNGGSFLAYPQIIALLMDRGHARRHLEDPARKGPDPIRPGRPLARVHPGRDRHHHPRRPGADARPDPQRAPRPGGGWRRDDLRAPTMTSRRMFALPALPDQGRRGRPRRRRPPPMARGPDPPRRARGRPRPVDLAIADWFEASSSIRSPTIRSGRKR